MTGERDMDPNVDEHEYDTDTEYGDAERDGTGPDPVEADEHADNPHPDADGDVTADTPRDDVVGDVVDPKAD